MKIAIITGASSGMGREFAIQLDQMKHHFDEFWLIARRESNLVELQNVLKTISRCIPLDLVPIENSQVLADLLAQEKPDIRFLVNCSGYGKMGKVSELDLRTQTEMIDLNCRALTAITAICIPYIGKKGRIVNLASIAAFLPQPQFAVYAATKAYVLSFSRALNKELRKEKISVTSVCPGPVKTEFFDVAESNGNTLFFKKFVYVLPEDVVAQAIDGAIKRKEKVMYSVPMKMVWFFSKILPHRLILQIYNRL